MYKCTYHMYWQSTRCSKGKRLIYRVRTSNMSSFPKDWDTILWTFCIRPSSSRVDAIRQMNAPTNLTEVRRCIGMELLGRSILDLSSLISPMTDLLNLEFAWLRVNAQADAFVFSSYLPLLWFWHSMIHVNRCCKCKQAVLDSGQRVSRKQEKSTNQSHIVRENCLYRV